MQERPVPPVHNHEEVAGGTVLSSHRGHIMDAQALSAARKRLRATAGRIADPRQRDIATREIYNAYIDRAALALVALKIGPPAPEQTDAPELDLTSETVRKQRKGKDRQHQGGRDRSE